MNHVTTSLLSATENCDSYLSEKIMVILARALPTVNPEQITLLKHGWLCRGARLAQLVE